MRAFAAKILGFAPAAARGWRPVLTLEPLEERWLLDGQVAVGILGGPAPIDMHDLQRLPISVLSIGGAITVVDEGGHILALERWDRTFPAASQISIGKARTAALFRKETKAFEDAINNGRTAMTALPDSVLTPLQGGVPIVVGGRVIGAVGVSGAASAQQDEELALAGIKALTEGAMR